MFSDESNNLETYMYVRTKKINSKNTYLFLDLPIIYIYIYRVSPQNVYTLTFKLILMCIHFLGHPIYRERETSKYKQITKKHFLSIACMYFGFYLHNFHALTPLFLTIFIYMR